MDPGKAALVVCITLFLVIGINVAIYLSFSGKRSIGQVELFRRAAKRARNPWEPEDRMLEELSEQVAKLKGEGEPQGEEGEGGQTDQH